MGHHLSTDKGNYHEVFKMMSYPSQGFIHAAIKIRGGSAINERVYSACQIPWDVF